MHWPRFSRCVVNVHLYHGKQVSVVSPKRAVLSRDLILLQLVGTDKQVTG